MSEDKQKKKKQQQQPSEFRSDPPIRSTLGTTRVTLDTLLATEDLVAAVCDFGILIPEKPPAVEEKVRSMSQGRAAGWDSANALSGLRICPTIPEFFSPQNGAEIALPNHHLLLLLWLFKADISEQYCYFFWA